MLSAVAVQAGKKCAPAESLRSSGIASPSKCAEKGAKHSSVNRTGIKAEVGGQSALGTPAR